MKEEIQKEIDRIKAIAKIYLEIKLFLPKYSNDYFEAYTELANRFDKLNNKD